MRGCRFTLRRCRGLVQRSRRSGGPWLPEDLDRKLILRGAGELYRAHRRRQYGMPPTDANVHQTLEKRFAVGREESVQ